MDRAKTDDLLASPLAKKNMHLAVIPAFSLLEMFFHSPVFSFLLFLAEYALYRLQVGEAVLHAGLQEIALGPFVPGAQGDEIAGEAFALGEGLGGAQGAFTLLTIKKYLV